MHAFRSLSIAAGLLGLAVIGTAAPAAAARPSDVSAPDDSAFSASAVERSTIAPSTAAKGRRAADACTDPVWTSSDPDNRFYTDDTPYILDMDMWNAAGYNISQSMNVCSHNSWYVDDTIPEPTDTAVKVYPDVHEDYINWSTGEMPALSSFKTIKSTYSGHGSGLGSYDVAYDIWLNGVASAGSNEVMVWTEARGSQTPAGVAPKVATNVRVSGRTWDVYAKPDNSYIAFVPSNGQSYPSGTPDLMAFFGWLMQHGNISSNSALGAIDYGVEIVSTDGQDARFTCDNFSISTTMKKQHG